MLFLLLLSTILLIIIIIYTAAKGSGDLSHTMDAGMAGYHVCLGIHVGENKKHRNTIVPAPY